jgi:hypothetical protein
MRSELIITIYRRIFSILDHSIDFNLSVSIIGLSRKMPHTGSGGSYNIMLYICNIISLYSIKYRTEVCANILEVIVNSVYIIQCNYLVKLLLITDIF